MTICEVKQMEQKNQAEKIPAVEDVLIDNLRELGKIIRSQYEGKTSQRRILIILLESGTVTQRDLTERLGIQSGSASEVLGKLEHANLISRARNAEDGRTTDLCLTDFGRMQAETALAQRKQRHREMFSCLSAPERQDLLHLTETVLEDWKIRYPGQRRRHGSEAGACGRDGA